MWSSPAALRLLFPHSLLCMSRPHLWSYWTHQACSHFRALATSNTVLHKLFPRSEGPWPVPSLSLIFLSVSTSNASSTDPINWRAECTRDWEFLRVIATPERQLGWDSTRKQQHTASANGDGSSSIYERKRLRCQPLLVSRLIWVEWGYYTRGNDQLKIKFDLHNLAKKWKVDMLSTNRGFNLFIGIDLGYKRCP